MRALALVALLVAAPGLAHADDWELRIAERVEVPAEAAGSVSLTVVGLGGRTISQDGPVRVELASDTLKLPRHRYLRRHAVDPAADAPRFELRLTAPAGEHELTVLVRFWLCGKRTCRPVRASRTIAVAAH